MQKAIKLLILILITHLSYAQEPKVTELSPEELASYEKQAQQLISFMEFAFNTLASDKSEYKDKHTIIEQSYLKFFRDDKVQIEDDLVEKRDVVTNKDVQAYLKDIDFFFKNATFKYTIEEITQEINESGDIFFKIKASRNLKGKTIENKEINDNRLRYIEINLDPSTRDLKIVSIYTTKSNEEQELISWWNSLTKPWRNFLAGDSKISDSVYLRDVEYIHNDYIIKEVIFVGYGDTLIETDTIRVNESKVLPEIRRILRAEEIDISSVEGIYNIEPLYAFSNLKHLDVSYAKIPDLDPIRNLPKLETLIASKSLIISIEPIRYIPYLRVLDVSGTLVSNLNPIETIVSLEELNVSESRVREIGVLSNLVNLKHLNLSRILPDSLEFRFLSKLQALEVLELSGLPIDTLNFLEGLSDIKRLKVDDTRLLTLDGVQNLKSLEVIVLDNTEISSLEPLKTISSLRMVYCDKTLIDSKKALAFMQARPDVKIIYESLELMTWWEKLSDKWKDIFMQKIELSNPPSREELHEISFIKNLNIAYNSLITDITPLSKLSSLTDLNISGTGVKDLAPLSDKFDLQTLNISYTKISDLKPLTNVTALTELNISKSAVDSIRPLINLPNLRTVWMDSTHVNDPQLLANLKRLSTIFADEVPGLESSVHTILDSLPDVLIVYQTDILQNWWKDLSPAWKDLFSSYEPVGKEPDRIQLHKITSLKEIDISNHKEIVNLSPLTKLKQLKEFRASNLLISDISPLALIRSLEVVDISNTPVADITPLTNHKYLRILSCANTQVTDLSPLAWHLFLIKLDISGTQVSKLDPLETCTSLEELNLYNTRVNNLKPLDSIKTLKVLRAYNTRLSERKIQKFKEDHPQTEVIYY